ncbi:FAD-binding oxidoreductase [Kitasatospora aureofaciens]|uniref:NAD(P)/FAD-dependent oxidoreductase n=1 Tax=Kitasatospora aureofaciens TaxID=1894 RepID=UPI001C4526CC|nr:FAD-binding oxidoreductase [Kitasatospora aureofaciens]MBV6696708.1 FAD-binding oxidoreductase [Kitasatospora aureofaciens]
MRICIIGAGLAGTLLAWRLRRGAPGADVCLVTAPTPPGEATAASGGLLRGFETDPAACRLAAESLAELRADPALARLAGYRETGSLYVTGEPPPTALLDLLENQLPGSAALVDPATAAERYGIDGPPDAHYLAERHAGYLSPDDLRYGLLRDFLRRGGRTVPGPALSVGPGAVQLPGHTLSCDHAVLATGRQTGPLLYCSGLDHREPARLRGKLIQYTVHRATGHRPPCFVDETTGLYGRPHGEGGMLLGVPTDHWDEDAEQLCPVPELLHEAEVLSRLRLPGLRLGRPRRTVVAADTYSASGLLELRATTDPAVHTFTGGSGGAAKCALAASRRAARGLQVPGYHDDLMELS